MRQCRAVGKGPGLARPGGAGVVFFLSRADILGGGAQKNHALVCCFVKRKMLGCEIDELTTAVVAPSGVVQEVCICARPLASMFYEECVALFQSMLLLERRSTPSKQPITYCFRCCYTRLMAIQMTEEGIAPNYVTFSAAVSACGKVGQWRAALSLLGRMRAANCHPNVTTYTAAIDACGKGGQWQRAQGLLVEMRAKGVSPNVVSYNSAMSALGNGGQWQRALDLLHEMPSMGVTPNVNSYTAAVAACGDNKQWARALAVHKQVTVVSRRFAESCSVHAAPRAMAQCAVSSDSR